MAANLDPLVSIPSTGVDLAPLVAGAAGSGSRHISLLLVGLLVGAGAAAGIYVAAAAMATTMAATFTTEETDRHTRVVEFATAAEHDLPGPGSPLGMRFELLQTDAKDISP